MAGLFKKTIVNVITVGKHFICNFLKRTWIVSRDLSVHSVVLKCFLLQVLKEYYDAKTNLTIISFAEEHGNRAAGRQFTVSDAKIRRWRQELHSYFSYRMSWKFLLDQGTDAIVGVQNKG